MWSFWLLLFVVACAGQKLEREAYVSVPQLIADAGYPVEQHGARTADGYALRLHRVPAGRRAARSIVHAPARARRPVLLVHGLFGSSGDFVIMGPRRSLAYLLADAGYDVWLGNLRGTYSSTHDNFTKADPQFWQFSFAEHGYYDVPAMIDTVLAVTGQASLLYIGYSMGTTSFFVMASERPEYSERVVAFVALAPAVYLNNVRAAADLAVNNAGWTRALRSRGVHAVSLRRELRALLAGEGGVCRVRRARDDVCMRLVYGFVGEDYEQNDWDAMPLVLARFQPASLRQLEHFAKIAMAGEFVSWGGGLNDRDAPAYNLTRVRVPVHLYYGENDMLTEKSQVLRLANALKLPAHPVRWPKFNHLDFVYARDLDRLLNRDLVQMVDRLYDDYDSRNTGSFESNNLDLGTNQSTKSDNLQSIKPYGSFQSYNKTYANAFHGTKQYKNAPKTAKSNANTLKNTKLDTNNISWSPYSYSSRHPNSIILPRNISSYLL